MYAQAKLNALLMSNEAEIIAVSETWLSGEIADAMLSAEHRYRVFSCNRATLGGGVCFFVKRSLSVREVHTVSNGPELIAIDLSMSALTYCFVCVYRAPSSGMEQLTQLCDCLTVLLHAPFPVFVLGDFNFADIDWSLSSRPSNPLFMFFLEFCLTSGLSQTVSSPTRGQNILDLMLCTHLEPVLRCLVIEPFGSSDHCALSADLIWHHVESHAACFRDFKRGNYDGINGYFASVDWAHVLGHCTDAQQMWNVVHSHMQHAVETFVPLASISQKIMLPVYLRKLHSKKRKLFCRRKTATGAAKNNSFCTYYCKKIRNYFAKCE